MAGKLVEMLEADWDPSAYEDTYRAAVLALIDAKAAGEEPPEAPEPAAPKEVDLLAALEASIAAGGGGEKRRRSAPSRKPSGPTDKPKGPPAADAKPKPKAKAKAGSSTSKAKGD